MCGNDSIGLLLSMDAVSNTTQQTYLNLSLKDLQVYSVKLRTMPHTTLTYA